MVPGATTIAISPPAVLDIHDAIAIDVFIRIRLTIPIEVPAVESVFSGLSRRSIFTRRTVLTILTGSPCFALSALGTVGTG